MLLNRLFKERKEEKKEDTLLNIRGSERESTNEEGRKEIYGGGKRVTTPRNTYRPLVTRGTGDRQKKSHQHFHHH